MNEAGAIAAVVTAIYASECVHAAPRAARVFGARDDGSWRASRPAFALPAIDRDLHVGSPWPGAHGLTACEARVPPVGVDGVCACGEGSERGAPVPWGALRELRADGAAVRAGERVVMRTGSESRARHVAAWLAEVRDAAPERREALVDAEWRALLDVHAARRQVRRERVVLRAVGASGATVGVTLFVATPMLLALGGWLAAGVGLLATYTLSGVAAARTQAARRRLAPEGRSRSVERFAHLLLAPPAAARAADLATRDLLAPFHALAVAKAADAPGDARDEAIAELRRLSFPLASEREACCPVGAAHRVRWQRHLAEWTARECGEVGDLLAPPPRGPGHAAWCPRCLAQYTRAAGDCADCDGVALRPFA